MPLILAACISPEVFIESPWKVGWENLVDILLHVDNEVATRFTMDIWAIED